MKHIRHGLGLILALLLIVCTIPSCSFEPVTIRSCGSGFYFDGDSGKTYKIKELNVTSQNNYFYLDDYFCSKSLGKEYKIKSGLSTVGSVYLAKKSDHYNKELFEFNVDALNSNILSITPDMNYVRVYSTEAGNSHELYIRIEERTLPLDLTLENVNIYTSEPIPVIYSGSACDINLILEGTNTLIAGNQKYTEQSFSQAVKDGALSQMEIRSIDDFRETIRTSSGFLGIDTAVFADSAIAAKDQSVLDGILKWEAGENGSRGLNGKPAIISRGGISIRGTGTLNAKGGDGYNGANANNSLFGTADGGKGGKGGSGVLCAGLLIMNGGKTVLQGGEGGKGGEPVGGLFGMTSGSKGADGKDGGASTVTYPRKIS